MMTTDMTDREWREYWQRITKSEDPSRVMALADQLCDKAGGTRREFVAAREAGTLAAFR